MSDNIAGRLEPFVSAEIRGIDSGEREAATIAAQRSLEQAQAMNGDVLIGSNLDAALLSKHVRLADPKAVERAGLGEAGAQLYDTLITECTSYIVSIRQQLPGYKTAEAKAILNRTSALIDITNQILDRLPSSAVPAEWGPGSEDQRFSNKYRKAVAEFSTHLQLYGVTSMTAKSRYPLSVAYISLSVDVSPSSESPQTTVKNDDEEWGVDASISDNAGGSLRIDALLQGTDYLLLTGNAGSGKTTLVQWLASSAIEGNSSPNPDKPDWRGRIPFIIPLRRYVADPLPNPQDFVGTIAPLLTGAMPQSWVHRVLASGRGMLLIDGLDELPVERRDEVREWVLSLIDTFPASKVLVTSRTTAITRGWSEAHRFRKANLAPMELPDIRSFIHHWHDAASSASFAATSGDIEAARKSLLSIVRDRPAIQSLCTSPLLCALVCALHLESGSNLPNNRMDVYKTALEMLVIRRDTDRKVDHINDAELGYREREILLRSFALWMHENGASDTTTEDYYRKIEKQLRALYRVKAESNEVGRYLLERSGVLREPVPGRVDFVHRTFLEYLAAAAIIDDDSVDRLVLAADEDHWREVIIMAAGHANSQQRIELLNGLLSRGDSEQELRPRLYMLAVACMETSPDLPADLVDRLQTALAAVLPPTNMTEAAAVASAGTLAVNMLRSTKQHATTAAACVRALTHIGGDEALAMLATYGKDSRITVTRQLIRGWSAFEADKYAEQVLRESPLVNGEIVINDPDQIAQLPTLKHASSVSIQLANGMPNLLDIPSGHPGIHTLELSQPSLGSVRQIPDIPNLRRLRLHRGTMSNLEGVERYKQLLALAITQAEHLKDISATNSLTNLKVLDIIGSPLSSLDSLDRRESLKRVNLVGFGGLTRIRFPVQTEILLVNFAPALYDLSGIKASSELRYLGLYAHSDDVERLALPASLEHLRLDAEACSGLKMISGGAAIETLDVQEELGGPLIEWIESLSSLHTFRWVSPVPRRGEISIIPTIETLFAGPSLRELVLFTTGEPPSVPGLEMTQDGFAFTYSRLS
ncbi:NACHT domain-containing protein [Arthrobacter sp. Helios]|uniref:NACHT domain-containing protein n=1 Tax=Arthrobacter sp. Helios TaxID=2828862 RepID=UPI00205AB2C3|nr:NACHT domain-containing protein [Arthrobacter sp. Helios]UPO78085.1 NACHT domain-containing protein [Arthrobacter sp. Helios]